MYVHLCVPGLGEPWAEKGRGGHGQPGGWFLEMRWGILGRQRTAHADNVELGSRCGQGQGTEEQELD